MDKHIKAGLAVVALSVLALPVKAQGVDWRCEMISVSTKNQPGGRHLNAGEKFNIRVTDTEVMFGADSYFQNARMRVVAFKNRLKEAMSEIGYLFFLESHPDFLFNGRNHTILASCDDF